MAQKIDPQKFMKFVLLEIYLENYSAAGYESFPEWLKDQNVFEEEGPQVCSDGKAHEPNYDGPMLKNSITYCKKCDCLLHADGRVTHP